MKTRTVFKKLGSYYHNIVHVLILRVNKILAKHIGSHRMDASLQYTISPHIKEHALITEVSAYRSMQFYEKK